VPITLKDSERVMPLTKSGIVTTLSQRLGCSKSRASKITAAFIAAVREALETDDAISIRRFGIFSVKQRRAGTRRHPVTGRPIHFAARRVVVFKAFKDLKAAINNAHGGARILAETPPERRRVPRYENLRGGTATVRVAGIPVCEFAINDYTDDGTGFLVHGNKQILRNLWPGREIEIKLPGTGDNTPSVYQRSRVVHITRYDDAGSDACFILGVQILSKITVE
jgi:DNA-binding protein HU-beta